MPALTFGQIETLLTGMLDIDPDRTSAITARFNTLRRLHFPEGVNVGATGRFRYDLKATMSTMVLFALIDALVLPQQAVTLVSRAWPSIDPVIRNTLSGMVFEHGDLPSAPRPTTAPYLVLRPEALAQLRPGAEEAKAEYRPSSPGNLIVANPDELATMIATVPPERPGAGLVVIDLHAIVRWTAKAIVRAGWAAPAALGAQSRP